jgi:hypothetical protein
MFRACQEEMTSARAHRHRDPSSSLASAAAAAPYATMDPTFR